MSKYIYIRSRLILLVPLLTILIFSCGAQGSEEVSTVTGESEPPSAEGAAADDGPSSLQVELMELGFRIPKDRIEAPDFTLENLAGEEVTLSSYRGTVVFLNFWATWCPPCREEMPSMETMYNELKEDGFRILAVDLNESGKTVETFLEDKGYTYDIALDTTGKIGSIYGARSIPTSYLLDREGFILGYIIGSRLWDTPEVYATLGRVLASD